GAPEISPGVSSVNLTGFGLPHLQFSQPDVSVPRFFALDLTPFIHAIAHDSVAAPSAEQMLYSESQDVNSLGKPEAFRPEYRRAKALFRWCHLDSAHRVRYPHRTSSFSGFTRLAGIAAVELGKPAGIVYNGIVDLCRLGTHLRLFISGGSVRCRKGS